MEIPFRRIDIYQDEDACHPRSLAVIDITKNDAEPYNRVVIGNEAGDVKFIGWEENTAKVLAQHNMTPKGSELSWAVGCIVSSERDRIFVASKNRVIGLSRKVCIIYCVGTAGEAILQHVIRQDSRHHVDGSP